MLCKDIMRRPVQYARRGETVRSAAQKMRDARIGFLPVCDDHDRVVGVVTDRDMAVRLCATGQSPATTPIEAIMSSEVVGCPSSADVHEAERLMAQHRKSRIVVVAENGAPEGVISLSDLVSQLGAEGSEVLRQVAVREVLGEHGESQRR